VMQRLEERRKRKPAPQATPPLDQSKDVRSSAV
jgi:hypothetical protein